jgi:AhpD family alkylhydroperoxidase
MNKRIQIDELEPSAFEGMFALENYLNKAALSAHQIALIKMRASQLNGCAFCINMHAKEALKNGETNERLFLLDAWKETELFSQEEKTLLALTEEITMIHEQGLSEATYQKAIKLFGQHLLSQIIMAITTINAWNRIAIATHKPFS